MKPPLFRPEAAADLEDAYDWYEAQRIGLGIEFLTAVADALDSIGAHPEQVPVLHRGTRRALLSRFPYGLFYRIVDDEIVIVACMHAERAPREWKRRR